MLVTPMAKTSCSAACRARVSSGSRISPRQLRSHLCSIGQRPRTRACCSVATRRSLQATTPRARRFSRSGSCSTRSCRRGGSRSRCRRAQPTTKGRNPSPAELRRTRWWRGDARRLHRATTRRWRLGALCERRLRRGPLAPAGPSPHDLLLRSHSLEGPGPVEMPCPLERDRHAPSAF